MWAACGSPTAAHPQLWQMTAARTSCPNTCPTKELRSNSLHVSASPHELALAHPSSILLTSHNKASWASAGWRPRNCRSETPIEWNDFFRCAPVRLFNQGAHLTEENSLRICVKTMLRRTLQDRLDEQGLQASVQGTRTTNVSKGDRSTACLARKDPPPAGLSLIHI